MSSGRRRRKWPLRVVLVVLLLSALGSTIPVRMAIARRRAPHPQAILVLGGDARRERLAAKLAQENPALHVWLSSGLEPVAATQIFREAGVSEERLHFDRRAIDTVTNFSTMVDEFTRRGIRHVYLVTSDSHMRRANMIATLIFGSQGVTFTSASVPTRTEVESLPHALFDCGRALMWIVTRYPGATPRDV